MEEQVFGLRSLQTKATTLIFEVAKLLQRELSRRGQENPAVELMEHLVNCHAHPMLVVQLMEDIKTGCIQRVVNHEATSRKSLDSFGLIGMPDEALESSQIHLQE